MIRRSSLLLPLIAIGFIAGILIPQLTLGGDVPVPALFDEDLRLAAAIDRSVETGKPVFVVVSADWCPPCKILKSRTLSDPDVAAWIEANTIPVYIDQDVHTQDAAMIPVPVLPTSLLINDGKIVSAVEGVESPGRYLEWLTASTAAASSATDG